MLNIEQLKNEYDEIAKKLANNETFLDIKKTQELSKRYSDLEKILSRNNELEKIEAEIFDTEKILREENDQDFIDLAKEDLKKLVAKKETLTKEINTLITGKKEDDDKDIIMEIRAGTGGDEASIFAADLFGMYKRFAEKNNWQINVLDSSVTEMDGYKEIVFEIKGKDVFAKMRNESGVHRVQRIPETEKNGRIQTSTATVAVLPQAEDIEIKIESKDLKIDTFRSSGPGGQNVNKVETAVRITHLPTGVVVACQIDRSQAKNKERALNMLKTKLLDMQTQSEVSKITGERRSQIGGAERSEKIRTYNFPQDRLTDHRIKKTWHNLEGILGGELDDITQTLQEELKLLNSQTL